MTAQAGSASFPSSALEQRAELRRALRAARRALSTIERQQARRQFARLLNRAHWLRPGRRIAVYLAYGHEAELSEVIALARRRGCRLYLPLITDLQRHQMDFVAFQSDTKMRINRYGIAEPNPREARVIPAQQLDLVLLPLVGFDMRGWRLGSGAGFYDRSLQHLRMRDGARRGLRRPKLIGVGYECQRVLELEHGSWDVPMDGVLTERALTMFRR